MCYTYGYMKILFLKNVPRVGQMHEVKEVADGYASFLLKNGSATVATDSAMKQASKKIEEAKMKAKGEESFAHEIAKKVQGLTLQIKGNANPKGNLYKSFHAKDIAEELTKKLIIGVSEELLEEVTIKNTGIHNVNIIFKGKKLGSFEVEVL